MATTETKTDLKSQDSATKRPNTDPAGGGQPRQGVEGPLADVQQDGTKASTNPDEHEGATEQQVGDRVGPGVGFDQEPEREKDEGGVS